MDGGDYWTGADRRPKRVVDLRGARCRRCPHPIRRVPVDKVSIARGRGSLQATFVCPHCRADAAFDVSLGEALRLFGAGAHLASRRRDGAEEEPPLTADDLLDFVLAVRGVDALAPRALADGLP